MTNNIRETTFFNKLTAGIKYAFFRPYTLTKAFFSFFKSNSNNLVEETAFLNKYEGALEFGFPH